MIMVDNNKINNKNKTNNSLVVIAYYKIYNIVNNLMKKDNNYRTFHLIIVIIKMFIKIMIVRKTNRIVKRNIKEN